ncbi:hypothetical protein JGUZn3_02470 [Entomobacter blattae]|uniref:Uncharacterized protein n=1 Tax=Entomobacter blattae TaxID=2762277 RepID=A0A7H1NNZ5_9PROT|nr:hypothetical protein JGUZn3_02470 [Entomobacter blattae]
MGTVTKPRKFLILKKKGEFITGLVLSERILPPRSILKN